MDTFVGMRSWRKVAALAAALIALLVVLPGAPAQAASTQVPLPAANNTGIWQDPVSGADFDGGGWSYSSLAIRLAGTDPGEAITSGGLTYTWPNAASGARDNLVTNGQTVTIPNAAPGLTTLGFLGAATHGPVAGKFVLNYSKLDETGKKVLVSVPTTIHFSDWTLNAASAAPSPRNTPVITTSFRMAGNTSIDQVDTNVFAVTTPVEPTMTLESVTLHKGVGGGLIHLFGMAVG